MTVFLGLNSKFLHVLLFILMLNTSVIIYSHPNALPCDTAQEVDSICVFEPL